MPTSMPLTYASVNQYAGIALEATYGTPVAMTNTLLVDANTPEDKYTFLEDKSFQGIMSNDPNAIIAGVRYADISFGGSAYMDTIGFLLGNILGDVTETGSAAPYTHKFGLLNSGTGQPSTHTLTHYTGQTPTVGARAYAGLCLSSLEFSWNAASGLLTYTAKGNAWASQAAGAAPTANPTDVQPIAAWRAQLGVGGTVASQLAANVSDGKVTITREIENEFGSSGVQDPYIIQRGSLSASFSMSVIANGESPLTTMIQNSQPQLQLLVANGASGSGAASIQFDMQKAAYTATKINFGAKAQKWDVSGKCVLNTTNAGASGGKSPLSVTLTNAIPSGTYL